MKKHRLLVLLSVICLLAILIPVAASADSSDGWYPSSGGRWCYMRDGQWVTDEVIQIGGFYYGFDEEGYMYADEEFWCDGWYYRATAAGNLYVNSWYEDKENDWWFYYGAAGRPLEDFVELGNTWYYFQWDGRMASDEVVWSNRYNSYWAISKDGTNSKKLGLGWTEAFGSWYYMYEHEDWGTVYAQGETMEIDGIRYYFDYDGKMGKNRTIWDGENDYYSLITASGAILKNGWMQVNGDWYYAKNYALVMEGVFTDGAYSYYFEDCKMYDIPGELYRSYDGDYYVGANGVLYRNTWYNDRTGYADEVGWAYYGSDCRRAYGLQTIGGVTYYFGYNGIMLTNTVWQTGEGVYSFDKDGKGTKVNGWFQHPEGKEWMYADNGFLAEGILTLADGKYSFNSGYMQMEDYYYADYANGVCYVFGKDGKAITKPGWNAVNGRWYYVKNTAGQLQTGWLQLGSGWYYLDPYAYSNTVFQDPESVEYYAADNNGVTTLLAGTGWRQLSWGRVYLENGKPLTNRWKNMGGSWYYFTELGNAVCDDYRWIDDLLYAFDADGKMYTSGWVNIHGESIYVDANGVAATGLKTIGGRQYLFSDNGFSYEPGVHEYNGKNYWISEDGSVIAQLKEGWNQIGSKWYYLRDGMLLQNRLLWEGNICYGFGSDYAMCTNGIKYAWGDYYMFDANGHILTGWQNFGGKWYYADPNSDDPYIYQEGVYSINGKDYVFKDGYMQVGTIPIYGRYAITDSNGVVIKWSDYNDGWNYTGSGYYYQKNGEAFTGWVGDYYVEHGTMRVNERIEYAGAYYYLGPDGRYVRNGWYRLPYGDYIYANANGTLKCNEWLLLGGKYYYFENIHMVCDSLCWIGDEVHEFNEDGVWLGAVEQEEPVRPVSGTDGWKMIGGKWYYYHANVRQYGARYIGGSWYFLDHAEDGAMATNAVCGGYYYGADGKRAAYTGWKMINGYWMYFDADYSMHYGWLKSGSSWYYLEEFYDEDSDEWITAMVSNAGVIYNNQLFHFNASGLCSGPVTKDGWYQIGADWYYIVNGAIVYDTVYEIDGSLYYFDFSGVMMTNGIAWTQAAAGVGGVYFGADGRAVTTQGWKQIEKYWIYIGANGFVYQDGIYRIGGKDYSFYGYIWAQ